MQELKLAIHPNEGDKKLQMKVDWVWTPSLSQEKFQGVATKHCCSCSLNQKLRDPRRNSDPFPKSNSFAYLVLDRIEQPLESALLHLQPICCKQHDDIEGRLLSAPRGFCPKRITPSLAFRLKFFDGTGVSVDSFVAGHRKIHVSDLRQLDVHCYKLQTVSTCCDWGAA